MRKNLLQLTCVFAFTLVVVSQLISTNAFSVTIYVDDDAGGGSGTSWANAFNNLQAAIGAAMSGDEIWVAKGVYKPGTSRDDTFNLGTGVNLYGGCGF